MADDTGRVAREIGTLWAQPNGDSRFIGSSSGVFFIKTVQKAFSSASRATSSRGRFGEQHLQSSTWSPDCMFEDTDGEIRYSSTGVTDETNNISQDDSTRTTAPWGLRVNENQPRGSYDVSKKLARIYFENWHALFPFLHGPSFLQELRTYCTWNKEGGGADPTTLSHKVIIKCTCSIAALSAPELQDRDLISACQPDNLLPVLGSIALKDNLTTIQALLSAQLYFIATLSLRAAYVTGGLLVRAMRKVGLHRCPFRYAELSTHSREMRKRIFWCMYVLDRFLSHALGQPIGLQDSDVDVCPPGISDLHQPQRTMEQTLTETSPDDTALHLPTTHPDHPTVRSPDDRSLDPNASTHPCERSTDTPGQTPTDRQTQSDRRRENQMFLSDSVKSAHLLGRALELFHKSIHVRAVPSRQILLLKADIDAWGNASVYPATGVGVGDRGLRDPSGDEPNSNEVFSAISYQQLILLINRPLLSLDPKSADFRCAIQTCIGAAKAIIQTLTLYSGRGKQIIWPGHLLAIWMSGLVLAFAARVAAYGQAKAVLEVSAALSLLKKMSTRWPRALSCCTVLEELLDNLQSSDNGQGRVGHHIDTNKTHVATYGRSLTKRSRQSFEGDSDSPSLDHDSFRGEWQPLNRNNHNVSDSQPPLPVHRDTLRNGQGPPTVTTHTQYGDPSTHNGTIGQGPRRNPVMSNTFQGLDAFGFNSVVNTNAKAHDSQGWSQYPHFEPIDPSSMPIFDHLLRGSWSRDPQTFDIDQNNKFGNDLGWESLMQLVTGVD